VGSGFVEGCVKLMRMRVCRDCPISTEEIRVFECMNEDGTFNEIVLSRRNLARGFKHF
jgi:hypothetical protein